MSSIIYSFISVRQTHTQDVVSSFGLKTISIDGQVIATTLKIQVKWNSPLHAAYWAAFYMHDFGDRPQLALVEQSARKIGLIRLYCLSQGQAHTDLLAIYTQAQILVREYEISKLKREVAPMWYEMFLDKVCQHESLADELPF